RRAVHHRIVGQLPVLPEVTSLRPCVWCDHTYEPSFTSRVLPASANTAAMIGAAALVPPKVSQPLVPSKSRLSYTATPVAGSATADTSAIARPEHPVVDDD